MSDKEQLLADMLAGMLTMKLDNRNLINLLAANGWANGCTENDIVQLVRGHFNKEGANIEGVILELCTGEEETVSIESSVAMTYDFLSRINETIDIKTDSEEAKENMKLMLLFWGEILDENWKKKRGSTVEDIVHSINFRMLVYKIRKSKTEEEGTKLLSELFEMATDKERVGLAEIFKKIKLKWKNAKIVIDIDKGGE